LPAILLGWRETPLRLGLVSGAAALLLLGWAILIPRRRYRSWGYAMTEDELHIQHGLWNRTRTVVPFGRVQHIDVAQGPIERAFGVGHLNPAHGWDAKQRGRSSWPGIRGSRQMRDIIEARSGRI
jgi:membrane protein YdbS with pleckstrin-like domain